MGNRSRNTLLLLEKKEVEMGLLSCYTEYKTKQCNEKMKARNLEKYHKLCAKIVEYGYSCYILSIPEEPKNDYFLEPKNPFRFIDFEQSEKFGRAIKYDHAEWEKIPIRNLVRYTIVFYKKFDGKFYNKCYNVSNCEDVHMSYCDFIRSLELEKKWKLE